jgi:hypothetical protein
MFTNETLKKLQAIAKKFNLLDAEGCLSTKLIDELLNPDTLRVLRTYKKFSDQCPVQPGSAVRFENRVWLVKTASMYEVDSGEIQWIRIEIIDAQGRNQTVEMSQVELVQAA